EASESFVCQTPATRESECTVTMRARVAIEEVGGRDVYLDSVAGTVWDTRGRDNLQAVPALLSSDDIMRIAGSTVIQAHGQLTIEYELHYLVGQAPFYINGPPLLLVLVRGRDAAGNIVETSSPGLGPGP
ncbi:MAG TPA: hypothetical protein VKI41_09380, partial [Vicinamibacteria bacterium]|nr:hypothetical protein [Vicinamibacteria bacterium]